MVATRFSHGPSNDDGARLDGWFNVLTGLGRAGRDKRTAAQFARTRRLDRDELEDLFHGEDMIARICEFPAKEMTREWIEIAGDPDGVLSAKLTELVAQTKLTEAITWARLYGGCLVVMIANDGRAMDQPLNIDGVRSLDELLVIDRWDVTIAKKYTDSSRPRYGHPELFEIRSPTDGATGAIGMFARIHESRCLVFDGALTGRRRKTEYEGWAQSVVERVYEIVRDFNSAYDGASALLQDYSQAVFKIKGLANMLMSDQDGKVIKRLQLLDLARSIVRAIPLDAEGEDFKREVTSLAGYPDLLDRMANRLAAAVDMPVTLLMGQAPAGLNATGDSDHRYWYNQVRAAQETILRPRLSRLLQVASKAIGFKPKDTRGNQIVFSFRPLWQPSEAEIATTRKMIAETDMIYHSIGALDSAEIGVSRFGGDKYSIETVIDQDAPEPTRPEPDEDDDPEKEEIAPGIPADKNVQDTALNGAQWKELRETVIAISQGDIDKDVGISILQIALPGTDETVVRAMVNKIKPKDKPAPPAIAPPQNQQPPGAAPKPPVGAPQAKPDPTAGEADE